MPTAKSIKLPPELKDQIAKAIKETLSIGDSMEVEVIVNGVIYDLKAEGCIQDVE